MMEFQLQIGDMMIVSMHDVLDTLVNDVDLVG